jgi:hypothetical protein
MVSRFEMLWDRYHIQIERAVGIADGKGLSDLRHVDRGTVPLKLEVHVVDFADNRGTE